MKTKIQNIVLRLISAIVIFMVLPLSAYSVAMSDRALERLDKEGTLDNYINILKDARERGVDQSTKYTVRENRFLASSSGNESVDTAHVLVLLVDFADNPYTSGAVSGKPAQFDSLLFSTDGVNPTGSMTEYYLENSYGKFYIEGDIYGWLRMPRNYSFYVGSSYGLGAFPHNSKMLALDAISAADAAGVDFSRYDNFGSDGLVDGLIIVHGGPGHEESASDADMHSHKWNLGLYKLSADGVTIDDYVIGPEESYDSQSISNIGVFCHEYGHLLGLPDLYDVTDQDNTSAGLGRWSLMATGSYNGGSRLPAHLDAWCKAYLGFVEPTQVTENTTGVSIPEIETVPETYKLWNDGDYHGNEYFLIENRQKTGFDAGLPGEGLLIYHVDESAGDAIGNNTDPQRYHVALEQADGLKQLEFTRNNSGDAGDPYPGVSDNRDFDDASTPDSRSNGDLVTQTAVWNISDPDSVMTANFDVSWSRPGFEMVSCKFDDADQNGWLEAGETVEFRFTLANEWLTAKNVNISLSSSDDAIDIPDAPLFYPAVEGDGGSVDNESDPIVFTLPDTLVPSYDTFHVVIKNYADSTLAEFQYQIAVGSPQVLLVDADRGADYQQIYLDDFYKLKMPVELWDCELKGTPPPHIVNDFDLVVWFTGDTASNLMSSADISVIEDYLDNGGSLFLTGQWLASELSSKDKSFLNEYLHAEVDGTYFNVIHEGVPGSPIGNNLTVRYTSYANQEWLAGSQIIPVNGGAPVFSFVGGGYSAVSYAGAYKTVFFNWGYEALSDVFASYDKREDVLRRVVDFLGGQNVDIYDGSSFEPLPTDFVLNQNYPNPFNPSTVIEYELNPINFNREIHVELSVYNTLGRRVKTLVDQSQSAGRYAVEWNGTDDSGHNVASGIYLYRLIRGGESQCKKMILLK